MPHLNAATGITVEPADGRDAKGDVIIDVPRGHVLAFLAEGECRERTACAFQLICSIRVLIHMVYLNCKIKRIQ